MVKIARRLNVGANSTYYGLISAAVLCTMALLFWDEGAAPGSASLLKGSALFQVSLTVDSAANNAQAMKAWRSKIRSACAAAKTEQEVLGIGQINKVGFQMPLAKQPQPRDHDRAVIPCRSLVLDFGANIGDTSGHVIDAGMIWCEKPGLVAKTPFVHFNVETKQFEDSEIRNPLTHQLVNIMKEFGSLVGPEDYCYYGVEGNPVFTERLQNIEDYVMGITPRPLKHMHFFTESVGAGEDGMTKLYLDTVNAKNNFWGSSIFKGHRDVRKSAAKAAANSKSSMIGAADVMGYTIGTLMRKTLRAFAPNASAEDKKGNHLVLKVDIEGGEYPLLHQAADEGTLCEFVKMGNRADLFIEFHGKRLTGNHEFVGQKKKMKQVLEGCGVQFRNLAATWA
jgi:hypothetical protein